MAARESASWSSTISRTFAEGGLDRARGLSLLPHALAPVAELPVLEVVSAVHILADLTLGLGEGRHDYLQEGESQPNGTRRRPLTWRDNEHAAQVKISKGLPAHG